MKSIRVLWCSLFASLLLVGLVQAQDVQPGDDFLQALDAKRYADSWDLASDYFRQSVSKADWTRQVTGARDPLGDFVSRKLRSSEPQTNPPGAPPGEYLLRTYDTIFVSQGAPRTETLPLVKGADGRWRAVGYFVR